MKVKYRESFNSFAPSILRHDVKEWFDLEDESPYMLLVAKVKKNKIIEMTEEQKNLFGIDNLNIKRRNPSVVMLIIRKNTKCKKYK